MARIPLRIAVGFVLAMLGSGSVAAARDTFGIVGGYAAPLGSTSDFATDGYTVEARWRHFNKGRSAFEIEAGYVEMELEGAVQSTIAQYEALARHKNQLAQQQGGEGNGSLVAEYGTLEIYHFGPNYLFFPWPKARFSPFVSFGGGIYNWRVPFRLKFFRTPFFGEQHSWEPVAVGGFYSGVVPEEQIDFTKQETGGGLSVGGGLSMRLTSKLQLGATARMHLIFSSGEGNREEGVDNQDYLDDITWLKLKGALEWRF